MSLKNGRLFQSQSLSLVTKLMLFYSLSTIGILIAIFLFLYPTFSNLLAQVHGTQANNITIECYEKIIITLLFGSLGAVLFGHIIARKGLTRMREFENTMDRMTIDSLHQRINLDEWPKELRMFANKFNAMLDRIQKSFTQLSQFSSDIAHELRVPIHNLRGMTEIALTKNEISNEQRKTLEIYMEECCHLSQLIESLLFLARSDHGQLELKKTSFPAWKEVLALFEYYQAMADEKNISLSCEGDAAVLFDSVLFKRVISNLLSNALRYTPANGKVTVTITPTEISIQDTGVGIAEEHLSKIFDRFYRVDPSRSAQSGGLGLGLAIVKSIVELHQGSISVKSKLNIGTSVIITIL